MSYGDFENSHRTFLAKVELFYEVRIFLFVIWCLERWYIKCAVTWRIRCYPIMLGTICLVFPSCFIHIGSTHLNMEWRWQKLWLFLPLKPTIQLWAESLNLSQCGHKYVLYNASLIFCYSFKVEFIPIYTQVYIPKPNKYSYTEEGILTFLKLLLIVKYSLTFCWHCSYVLKPVTLLKWLKFSVPEKWLFQEDALWND